MQGDAVEFWFSLQVYLLEAVLPFDHLLVLRGLGFSIGLQATEKMSLMLQPP